VCMLPRAGCSPSFDPPRPARLVITARGNRLTTLTLDGGNLREAADAVSATETRLRTFTYDTGHTPGGPEGPGPRAGPGCLPAELGVRRPRHAGVGDPGGRGGRLPAHGGGPGGGAGAGGGGPDRWRGRRPHPPPAAARGARP